MFVGWRAVSWNRGPLLPLLLGVLAACGPSQAEVLRLQEVERRLKEVQAAMTALTATEDAWRKDIEEDLRETMAAALCRPETRELLEDVRTRMQQCDPRKNPAALSNPEMCTTRDVQSAVMKADPQHRGRFLSIMTSQRHEAFYPVKGKKASGYTLHPDRIGRLDRMMRQRWLRNTRILVVAHPIPTEHPDEVSEASRRADVILRLLRDKYHVPDERVWLWVYAYPFAKGEIVRLDDLPLPGEPPDPNRGVWVFRVDC